MIVCILSIFFSWFFILRHEVRPVDVQHNTYLLLNESVVADSVANSIYDFKIRVDCIEKQIEAVRDKYQNEVDLMIDKANGWMAFWIGVLALVIGLMSIWNIYRQNKNEAEFNRLEKEVKDKIDDKYEEFENRINGTVKDKTDELDGKIDDFEKRLKESEQTLRASRLSSLMMCLSSFPDPQMADNSSDKKRQMCKVLKHVSSTYHDYVVELCKDIETHTYNTDNIYLVLTVVKLAIVRTHGIYSDIHQNIKIQRLHDYIADTNKMILEGVMGDQLPVRIKEIDTELADLLRVIEL